MPHDVYNTAMNESSFNMRAKNWDRNTVLRDLAGTVAKHIKMSAAPGGHAIDLGCGTGLLGLELMDHFTDIVFADSSDGMLEEVRNKLAHHKKGPACRTLRIDLDHDELPGTYDCIFSQMSLHHINDTERFIAHIVPHLTPQGIVCIADVVAEDGSFHQGTTVPHNGFNPSSLRALFGRAGLHTSVIEPVFTITKPAPDTVKDFPIFLMIGKRTTP